jgi:hypothetical protein
MVVFNEMEVVIKDIVSRSFADSSYPKAIKALQAYRTEAIEVTPFLPVESDWCSWMSHEVTTTFYCPSRRICSGVSWVEIGRISGP